MGRVYILTGKPRDATVSKQLDADYRSGCYLGVHIMARQRPLSTLDTSTTYETVGLVLAEEDVVCSA